MCAHFLAKTYAKTKEIDPVGGGGRVPVASPLDPPMIFIKNQKVLNLGIHRLREKSHLVIP